MELEIEKILKSHSLRITAIRKDILEVFYEQRVALSNKDIESSLEESDRITIYRTLKKFEECGIIHEVFDDSQQLKYALCSSNCDAHQHEDSHYHFKCRLCQQTYCLDDTSIPAVDIPKDYVLESSEILLKGICAECN